jgi:hypothetical protein
MSDEPEQEAPKKIVVYQSLDTDGHICWRAKGCVARDPAGLAKLLGVAEDQLTHAIDMEAWQADQRRHRRIKSRVVPSSPVW